jgi:tetratricopeptide (TPR) repeat protein
MPDPFQTALQAFINGRTKQAENICKAILKKQPAAHPVLHLLALAEKRRGKYQQAIKTLNKAIKLAPTTPNYWNNLGETFREAGNPDKAIDCYKKALGFRSDYAEAYCNWGATLVSKELFSQAEKLLLKAVAINPELANAHYNLGVLHIENNLLEQARLSFNKALSIAPENIEALVNLATIDQSEDKYEDAKARYKRALSIDPGNHNARISLGNLCNNTGFYDEAIEHYLKATTISPKSLEAWIGLGQAYQNSSFLDAYHAFNTALSINPRSKEAMLGLAGSALSNCDNAEAIQTIKRYQETFGKDSRSRLFMANLHLDSGNHEEAVNEARSCLANEPENIFAYQVIALSNATTNMDTDLRQMLQLFSESDICNNGRSTLAFSIARIMDIKGDYASAYEYLEAANRLRKESFDSGTGYVKDIRDSITQLKSSYTPEFIETHKGYGFDGAAPIFIVGLPRSGKTVTETILCKNTRAIPGGESRQFAHIIETELKNDQLTTFQESILNSDKHQLHLIGERYVRSLQKRFKTTHQITNTLPGNASRLGAISICLPKARIIWVDRAQLDTCFDMYRKDFEKGHEYSYDLNTLARYTSLFNELMEHWTQVLPGNIYKLRFEDLISEPAKWLGEIAEFCQLDMDTSMANGEENANGAITGHELIPDTEDICGIWTAYEKQLQPLIQAIKER